MNKKIIYSSLLGFALFFSYISNANAISVGWDRFIVGGLKTLYSGDKVVIGNTATTTNATLEVVGQIASGYYVATSTNATSTFSGDLRFDTELLPDGLICANGEILKKTGANDWDCASDATGSSVGTVSTSSTPTIGNLAYWTSAGFPSLLGTVATTSLTATSPLSLSQPISVLGSAASALSISVAGDWTGTIDSNNFAGGAIGAGELIYGGSAGSFSELALGTNGYVLALAGGIPAWVATTTLSTISGTLDISSQSNLTAGTGITLTNDDLSIDTSQNIATLSNLTGNGFVKTSGGAGTLSVDTSTYLTTVDISANTNLAATAPIVLTGDTLSLGNITTYPAFTYATSSASFTGTTTIPLGVAMVAETWNSASCFTDVGTVWLAFDDGTNVMNYLQASTTVGVFTLSSNNSFSALEKRYVKFGNAASSPTRISCTVSKSFSAN